MAGGVKNGDLFPFERGQMDVGWHRNTPFGLDNRADTMSALGCCTSRWNSGEVNLFSLYCHILQSFFLLNRRYGVRSAGDPLSICHR